MPHKKDHSQPATEWACHRIVFSSFSFLEFPHSGKKNKKSEQRHLSEIL